MPFRSFRRAGTAFHAARYSVGRGSMATASVATPHAATGRQRSPRRRISRLHVISFAPTCLAARATDACTGLGYQVEERADACLCRGVVDNYQPTPLAERSRGKCPIPDIGLASTAKKAQRSMGARPWRRMHVATETVEANRKLARRRRRPPASTRHDAPARERPSSSWSARSARRTVKTVRA